MSQQPPQQQTMHGSFYQPPYMAQPQQNMPQEASFNYGAQINQVHHMQQHVPNTYVPLFPCLLAFFSLGVFLFFFLAFFLAFFLSSLLASFSFFLDIFP
jgi:hypothetical protein